MGQIGTGEWMFVGGELKDNGTDGDRGNGLENLNLHLYNFSC